MKFSIIHNSGHRPCESPSSQVANPSFCSFVPTHSSACINVPSPAIQSVFCFFLRHSNTLTRLPSFWCLVGCLDDTSTHNTTMLHFNPHRASTQRMIFCDALLLWHFNPVMFYYWALQPCSVILVWHFDPVMFYYCNIWIQSDGMVPWRYVHPRLDHL
jgi:hypothetical protein